MDDPLRIAIAGGGYGAKVALPVYQQLAEGQQELWGSVGYGLRLKETRRA